MSMNICNGIIISAKTYDRQFPGQLALQPIYYIDYGEIIYPKNRSIDRKMVIEISFRERTLKSRRYEINVIKSVLDQNFTEFIENVRKCVLDDLSEYIKEYKEKELSDFSIPEELISLYQEIVYNGKEYTTSYIVPAFSSCDTILFGVIAMHILLDAFSNFAQKKREDFQKFTNTGIGIETTFLVKITVGGIKREQGKREIKLSSNDIDRIIEKGLKAIIEKQKGQIEKEIIDILKGIPSTSPIISNYLSTILTQSTTA